MLKNQLDALEKGFKYLSNKFYNNTLNEDNTIITIQSKGKTNSYGWCSCDKAWYDGKDYSPLEEQIPKYYEINISAEHLNRGFGNNMETLLHEMVHLDNILHNINDCSSRQFHNENFKKGAKRVGLNAHKVKQYGYAETSMTRGLIDDVHEFIVNSGIDVEIFNVSRIDKVIKKVTRTNKKIKMVCSGCGNIVSCDDEINITCKDCGIEFIKK